MKNLHLVVSMCLGICRLIIFANFIYKEIIYKGKLYNPATLILTYDAEGNIIERTERMVYTVEQLDEMGPIIHIKSFI